MTKKLDFGDENGVWRTIGGRRVFIKDGQDLATAMIESGKFKNLRSSYRKAKEEETQLTAKQIDAGNKLNEKAENGVREDIKQFLNGEQDYDGTREEFIKDLSDNWNVDKDKVEEILHEENLKHPRLFKNKKQNEEMFKSTSTNPFYPDKEYTSEELKQMEEKGVKPMNNTYSGYGWKGVNADKNLSTKEQAKAITDAMKEQYPDVKISRKSDVYSGGSSIDFNIMSSDKDLYISDSDIDKMTDFGRLSTGYGFERWAEENVKDFKRYTHEVYTTDDVRKYAKETLNNLKQRDNQNVSGDEWYLSDYGKKVVSELNKQANSYTYDDSDAMTDYFNHGTYMNVSIGKWNKPYEVNKSTNSTMNNAIRQKAYKKYLKEHPASKLTFEDFKNMNSK